MRGDTMRGFIGRIYILGLAFVAIVALTTFANYTYYRASLEKEIRRNIDFKLESIVEKISSELIHVENILDAAGIVVELEKGNDNHILEFFRQTLTQNSSLISIYLSTPDNKTIYADGWVPPADLIVPSRPWYRAAVEKQDLIFTAPYPDAAADRLVVTMAKPVYEDGHLLGVVGVDKSLETIVGLLDREKASEQGHSFFFTGDGEIVVHPEGDYGEDELTNLCSVVDCGLFAQPRGVVRTTLHGREGYLRWEALKNLQLIVGTFAPLDDFFDRRALNLQMIAATLLASIVIFYLLFVFQRRYIIKPIRDLDRDVMAISVDDLGYRLAIDETHAFPALRQTINETLTKTQEHFENVMYQQEELGAAYAQLVAHEKQLQTQYDEIKHQEARIRFLADHDPLTGLLNRRKFTEDVQCAMEAGGSGAVFMLDIDNFKVINDTQGHVYGDKILQFVAGVLEDNPRQEVTAYRFAADKFLVHIEGESDPQEITRCINALIASMHGIRIIAGKRTHITASMGVVRYPYHGATVDELLIKADIALHNAKIAGKNRVLFFEEDMAATFSQKVHIEQMLVEALQAVNFKLLYQPIIHAHTGDVAYFEALIRIRDEAMSPAVFIAVAEESNLILPIGRWVMEEAISQLIKWQRAGKKVKPISINLSTKQFYDDGLVDFLEEQLARYDLHPSLLEMEITETVLIGNPEEALEIIKRIKELGVRISLDDFGTGYSSINYITRMPVDRIKLDRNMTEKLGENIAVMEGLVAIAHGLDMDVVGEGVETMEEARLLMEVGCDYLQGFLFSVPVGPAQAGELIEASFGEYIQFDN